MFSLVLTKVWLLGLLQWRVLLFWYFEAYFNYYFYKKKKVETVLLYMVALIFTNSTPSPHIHLGRTLKKVPLISTVMKAVLLMDYFFLPFSSLTLVFVKNKNIMKILVITGPGRWMPGKKFFVSTILPAYLVRQLTATGCFLWPVLPLLLLSCPEASNLNLPLSELCVWGGIRLNKLATGLLIMK